MQASQKPIMWNIIICTALILAVIFFTNPSLEVPTAQEIAGAIVIPQVVIPTAQEISQEIDMPDTYLSIRDEKKQIAIDLSKEEFTQKDFLKDLVEFIEAETEAHIDWEDITDIQVKDVDVSIRSNSAKVEFELKVYFNDFGDEDENEYARLTVKFDVDDLDHDDSYEDAEVDYYRFNDLLADSF